MPIFDILLADIFDVYGDWKTAKKHSEKAKNQNIDSRIKVEGILKYGEILYLECDYENALKNFNEASNYAIHNNYKKEEARALNDVGLIHFALGELNEAENIFLAVLQIRKEIKDQIGTTTTLACLGSLYSRLGNKREALNKFNECLKICGSTNNIDAKSGVFNGLGEIYMKARQFDKAFKFINDSLRINIEIGNKDGIGGCHFLLGKFYRDKGDSEKALESYERSKAICIEIGGIVGLSATYNDVGIILMEKKKYDEAFDLFSKNIEIITDTNRKLDIATAYHNFGVFYGSEDNNRFSYNESLYYLFMALAIRNPYPKIAQPTLEWVNYIRAKIEISKFRILAKTAYNRLPAELKTKIPLEQLCLEPIVAESKLGRNAPCHCGSGRKYKNCHGAVA